MLQYEVLLALGSQVLVNSQPGDQQRQPAGRPGQAKVARPGPGPRHGEGGHGLAL